MAKFEKALVTGGGGFVGLALCKALRARGCEVISIARTEHSTLAALGVKAVRADLGQDPSTFENAFAGVDVVFHTAAKVDMWGRREDFVRANATATQNVIACCRKLKVPRLVFTSSPSVIAGGGDLSGVNESYPYPKRYTALYPETKAMAEQAVLAAHRPGELGTIALRPHLIWGPGDAHFVPTILKRARAGKLVQVGDGKNRVDLCYIDDCVDAHLGAASALGENPAAGGRAYFISHGEPVLLWEWIADVLQRHGVAPVTRRISKRAALALAGLAEGVCKLLPGKPEPFLTRFLVCEMVTDHFFDISAARRELNFNPKVSVAEAFRRTFPA